MSSLSRLLDELAAQIAEDLQKPDVGLSQKLEAFRILSAREAAQARKAPSRKPAADDGDDEDDEPADMADFRQMSRRIRQVS